MISDITLKTGSDLKNSFYELKSTYMMSSTENTDGMVERKRRN